MNSLDNNIVALKNLDQIQEAAFDYVELLRRIELVHTHRFGMTAKTDDMVASLDEFMGDVRATMAGGANQQDVQAVTRFRHF